MPYYSQYLKLREARGVTDYRVAKDIGVSNSFFPSWKQGIRHPKLETLYKIAQYFGVPLEFFVKED